MFAAQRLPDCRSHVANRILFDVLLCSRRRRRDDCCNSGLRVFVDVSIRLRQLCQRGGVHVQRGFDRAVHPHADALQHDVDLRHETTPVIDVHSEKLDNA